MSATGEFTGRTAWARNLAAPVRDYLSTETGGAMLMLAATLAALIWANVSAGSYDSVWNTKLSIVLGDARLVANLRHWVNEGLMTFFFLVVGLEARRELDLGELRERSRVAVPVLAAIGGMLVPIAIYVAFNAGGPGARGWGAAMSTDTAFALGLLALVAPRSATRLRVFLLTLAVFDDLVALLVIAIAYTKHVSVMPLAVAVVLFGLLLVVLRYVPAAIRRELRIALGVAIWVAMFKSGVDPVVSGLAIGLVTSAYAPVRDDLERVTEVTRSFREQPTPELARSAQLSVLAAISPNERLQYRLHPWTSYGIVPVFALANAGIHVTGSLLSDALSSPITLGILVGYVVGKPVGISAAVWLASRPWLHGTRLTVGEPLLAAGSTVAGIGFTVSLLISSLAFSGEHLAEAKLGVLAAAVGAAITSRLAFPAVALLPAGLRARTFAATAEELLDLDAEIDPDDDHIRGGAGAVVTLVEYGDYECPYCGQAETVIRELLDSFGHELRYVWRHLPLSDVHIYAQTAAEAAEAAGAQGQFWAMHDRLIASQDELGIVDLVGHAEALGLDVERFESELRRREYAPRVARDVASADASGVAGTPTFFINGRRHYGAYDIATLTSAVKNASSRALRRAAATAAVS